MRSDGHIGAMLGSGSFLTQRCYPGGNRDTPPHRISVHGLCGHAQSYVSSSRCREPERPPSRPRLVGTESRERGPTQSRRSSACAELTNNI
jgi:hypothetical protein